MAFLESEIELVKSSIFDYVDFLAETGAIQANAVNELVKKLRSIRPNISTAEMRRFIDDSSPSFTMKVGVELKDKIAIVDEMFEILNRRL